MVTNVKLDYLRLERRQPLLLEAGSFFTPEKVATSLFQRGTQPGD
jgi:hypothetical protein